MGDNISTTNGESESLDSSFQLDWMMKHENEEVTKIKSPTVWQAVIEHDLNVNFESVDEGIAELLESNIAMVFSIVSDNQVHDDVLEILSRFPRVYWLLKDANSRYRDLKSGKLDSKIKAQSMILNYSYLPKKSSVFMFFKN
ncbi:hypothetical protein [Secundilactobacillus muriivasis]